MNESEKPALCYSFFAIPEEDVAELTEAYSKWNGFYFGDELDDSAVVRNAIYRRASAVAVHQVDFPGKEARFGASDVVIFFARKAWPEGDHYVSTPDECCEYARVIDAAIKRRGGVERVMQLLARRSSFPKIPAATMHTYYRGFRDVLDRAIERGCGFTYAIYEDGAEDRFEEAKAAFEELERELERERLEPPPAPTPEQLARLEEIGNELDEMRERRQAQYDADSRNPEIAAASTDEQSRTFAAVPATFMDDLCALDAEALACADHDQGQDLLLQLSNQAYEEARVTERIRTRGERSAFANLCDRLERHRPGTIRESGVYSPAATRALDRALASLYAYAGGRQALIADITRAAYGQKEPFTVSMLTALESVLGCAVGIGGGLVHWHTQL